MSRHWHEEEEDRNIREWREKTKKPKRRKGNAGPRQNKKKETLYINSHIHTHIHSPLLGGQGRGVGKVLAVA